MKYCVFDSTGNILRIFHTYADAFSFKLQNNRFDWQVKIV